MTEHRQYLGACPVSVLKEDFKEIKIWVNSAGQVVAQLYEGDQRHSAMRVFTSLAELADTLFPDGGF